MSVSIAPSTSQGARPFGLIAGVLGGLLVLVASFLEWLPEFSDQAYPVTKPDKMSLILAVAILIGMGVAWVWEELSAGAVFAAVAAGIVLYSAVGGLSTMFSIGAEKWSVGLYLALIGALLTLLGGLMTLATRPKIVDVPEAAKAPAADEALKAGKAAVPELESGEELEEEEAPPSGQPAEGEEE